MEEMYNVSSNPHVRDKMTTSRIMQLVVIALLPATLFGIWNFGFHALLVVLVTVISSVFLNGCMTDSCTKKIQLLISVQL